MLNLLYANEKAGEFPPSWYAASAPPPVDHPVLKGDVTADVCVVGAGFTGLSTALHLAEKGYDVVVLEAHRIGWGASGRNGGQVGTGQRIDQPELEETYGMDQARALWSIGEAGKALVKDLVAEHDIDCALKPGIVYTNHRRRYDAETRAWVDHMAKHYDYELRYLDAMTVQDEVKSPRYYSGALDIDAGHLHPLKYARGLGAAAVKAGVRIYEMSEVHSIDTGRVSTSEGTVRATEVVVACNGYLGALIGEVPSKVMPINNFIVATEPLSDAQAQDFIPNDYAVADSKFVVNYFRLSEDRRLLFGGKESYGYRFPRDIKSFVRNAMIDIFPQSAPLKIDYGWGGTLAITMNRLPCLARVRGVWTASGYSGYGVALATMSGKILADAIGGQMERFDVMSRLPMPRFPGGPSMRHPLLVLAMLWYSLRDRL